MRTSSALGAIFFATTASSWMVSLTGYSDIACNGTAGRTLEYDMDVKGPIFSECGKCPNGGDCGSYLYTASSDVNCYVFTFGTDTCDEPEVSSNEYQAQSGLCVSPSDGIIRSYRWNCERDS
ncbi:hypothetical protein PRZ48_011887 [Zasmidium cellare]|uniref:Apple domain-containing protein n=1 Tax=Zasmidium cellare TaxID=395010 RepID=A0ABR0E890_ZASCE|nr:hypothetical protein PRZ48_011887 [Zasmidium cellare]